MAEQENVQQAKDAYAEFTRGDIPAVLDSMTDDVEWVISPGSPLGGTFRGKAQVGEWFKRLGGEVEYTTFEPAEFIAQGDKVVVLVHLAGTGRATAKKFVDDVAHVLTYRGGKLAHFRAYTDTATEGEALRK